MQSIALSVKGEQRGLKCRCCWPHSAHEQLEVVHLGKTRGCQFAVARHLTGPEGYPSVKRSPSSLYRSLSSWLCIASHRIGDGHDLPSRPQVVRAI